MILIKTDYLVRARGLQDVTVEREVRPNDEESAHMLAILERWLAGDLEPVAIYQSGHANVAARETLEHTTTRDPKRPSKRVHHVRPIPIVLARDVAAAKIRRRGPGGTMLDQDGNEYGPILRVVLNSGNKFDLPWTEPGGSDPVEAAVETAPDPGATADVGQGPG